MKPHGKFYFGADYYPEQWPDARWSEDAHLMREAGFNVVRLAEFAWAKMEPSDGVYEFEWLDRAIQTLSAAGIVVVLGTPTASPPPWLMAKTTELFLVEASGIRRTYGARRQYCPTHPLYKDHTARIVGAMVEHYKGSLAVIGWQIDNEMGDRCYCQHCRAAFHHWLQRRYSSLEDLNEKWGTAFWSHIYTDWTQIPVPLQSAAGHNPALALDYRRFMSDTYQAYQALQIDIIRSACPEHFITHNLMGFGYNQLNYYDLAADLDLVSWDNYVRHQWDLTATVDPTRAALSHDAMRGLKKRNYWVMEQQAGSAGWDLMGFQPKPGELRLWTYQSLAHGADGIVYFRWRTARFGTEQHWFGILDPHGAPGRRYAEVARTGAEIRKVTDALAGTSVEAAVAILQSYDSRFAFQVQPGNPRFSYEGQIQDFYRGLYDNNVPVDIVSEDDLLTGYRLVIAPSLHVLPERTATRLEQFALEGGTVVLTLRTGVKDMFNATVESKLPGLAAQMCGIEVEECLSFPADQEMRVSFKLSDSMEEYDCHALADVIQPNGAEPIGWYAEGPWAGKVAATVNTVGKGKVVYLGILGRAGFYHAVASWLAELTRAQQLLVTPAEVEVTERRDGNRRVLFVLNHADEERTVGLDATYRSLLDDRILEGHVEIEPFGVRVLSPS